MNFSPMNLLALALPFDFEQPSWLWLIALVPVLAIISARSLTGIEPIRRVMAIVARSVLIILLACCLAGVRRVQRNEDLTVIFLMDRSHSVAKLQDHQDDFIRTAAENIPADDRLGLIDFARNAFLQQLPMRGGYFVQPGRLPVMPDTDRTNVAAALRLAMAMFPHDTSKRIVLMSDGNDNMGDVYTEARRAKADGIPIDVVPLWYQHTNEVFFERMIAPSHAEPGEQLPIRMVLNTRRRVSGAIRLHHNGKLVDLPPGQTHVELRPGRNTFYVKLSADDPGTQVFEATFQPDDESMDSVALNNTASAFTFVSGASRALLLTADPAKDAVLVEALRRENVRVDMKTPRELGDFGLMQMTTYATIILANIPAATFTDQQQHELATYVKDLGSGLIMIGGDESFGAGGWIGSPVEEVMPITFEIKHKRVIPRGALAIIMHSCEIPRGNYWGKEMAKKAVDTVSSRDYIGVLSYTYSPPGENWSVPMDLASNKSAVKARIDRMQIGDMPDFGRTMQMVYDEMMTGRASDAAQKHVIILSDGDAQRPSPALLKKYSDAKITCSTIGIGWGAHVFRPTLQEIAARTGGKFYAARKPRELPQIFVKESKVIRRPLIIDEPFQPQVLHAYSELLGGINPGVDVLPPLGGMVLTSPKINPAVQIPLIRATDDGEDPVLIHWQYGLGKSVAFTSGFWPVWGQQWTQWSKYAKFWAQLVRWTMRQENPANFDTYVKIEGNRGRIIIDALDKDASYLNFLQMRSKMIGPDTKATPLEFHQTGPGHYEAEFEADRAGQYLTAIELFENGKSRGTIRTGVAIPFSPEHRDVSPNEALLRQVAQISGGRWLDVPPEEADVFSHDLPPSEAKRPAWEWVLAWLLLPGFLLDVSVRRLASWLALSIAVELVLLTVLLFGVGLRFGPWWGILGAVLLAELIGWTIRFRYIRPLFDFVTHGVVVLGTAGKRSEAALSKLKDTRQRVHDDLTGGQPAGDVSATEPSTRARRSKAGRRFDVGDEAASEAVGDLSETLGGASATKETGAPKETGKPDAKDDEGSISRLLRAKRRTQRDTTDDE